MLAYVRPMSLFSNIVLFRILYRHDLPLNEFGVQFGTFISEHRIVRHIPSRRVPAIACFLVFMSNLERLPANRVQSTELDASFRKSRPVIVFSCCIQHTCG